MKDSYMQRKEDIVRKWYVVDAEGMNLGRLATKVAHILRGKHKPTYTPNMDCGDYVIVINASKINLTGNKLNDKINEVTKDIVKPYKEELNKILNNWVEKIKNYNIDELAKKAISEAVEKRFGKP